MQSTEKWLPVLGHEGAYEVSDHGKVRSIDRIIRHSTGHSHKVRGKLLTPWADRKGYLRVGLPNRRRAAVHQLVLEAFVGVCPPLLVGCHANDNPVDNRAVNLRWGTRSENSRDAVRNGRNKLANKTHCIRGHEFTRENTAVASTGQRNCKRCAYIYWKARYRGLSIDEYITQYGEPL